LEQTGQKSDKIDGRAFWEDWGVVMRAGFIMVGAADRQNIVGGTLLGDADG
jgi:hypothetical protein